MHNYFDKDIKRIHFIGLGGIGISALAKFFIAEGAQVSGSDSGDNADILEELSARGVEVFTEHRSENLSDDVDLIVYSSAVPEDNPERLAAKERFISEYSYPEALGKIMERFYGIAVSGTNGKTTTTSLLGKIFEQAQFDPHVVVGGKVPGWDGNLRLSENPQLYETAKEGRHPDIFLAEVCEYRRNMLSFSPQAILLTNIEEDHLDYYDDLEDILEAFQDFLLKLPESGICFFNADDPASVRLSENAGVLTSYTYAVDAEADLRAENILQEEKNGRLGQSFEVVWQGENLGKVFLPLPGIFNVSNALGAMLVALVFDVSFDHIQEALEDFRGTWRRFERVGTYEGRPVISDYAHHPTAVLGTIEAAKAFYPEKKILNVFQPHQRDRTQKLFPQFLESLEGADGLICPEIYEVSGREESEAISSEDLIKARKNISDKPAFFAKDLMTAKELIAQEVVDYDVLLFMGAGDIHNLAKEIGGEADQEGIDQEEI